MLWNVEGLMFVLNHMTVNELFLDCSIVLMTETFVCTDDINLANYAVLGVDTKRSVTGRPQGGLISLIKQSLSPRIICKSQNCLTVSTIHYIVLLFYFPPDGDVSDIILAINEQLSKVVSSDNILLTGDFNCRIDEGTRGTTLTNHMQTLGFQLLNNKKEFTYISPQGNSAIDLIFIRNERSRPLKYLFKIKKDPIRKHQRVYVNLKIEQSRAIKYTSDRPSVSRKIDVTKLKNREKISDLETAILDGK